MEKFESVLLTAAKRPALFEDQGEVECLVQDKVALYDRDNKTKNEDGLLRLTTHRLIWQGAKGEALGVSLALVTTTELQVDLPVLSFLTRQPSDFSSSFFFFLPGWLHGLITENLGELCARDFCEAFIPEWWPPGLLDKAAIHYRGSHLEGMCLFSLFDQASSMIIQSCGVLQKKQVEVAAAAKAQKIEFDPSRAGIGQCFLLPRFLAFLRFSAHDI